MDIIQGDALTELQKLPDESVHCCVTSPPYYGLRDYGFDGQIGLEKTPGEYVIRLVEVFREVKRVLRNDGTLWLNLGDSYAGSWGNAYSQNRGNGRQRPINKGSLVKDQAERNGDFVPPGKYGFEDLHVKPKDLIGIPWRVAFALQADGWYLRQDIIWHKPNPMPESVRDRCTKSHEYVFLLTKNKRYFWDQEAVKESQTKPKGSVSGYNKYCEGNSDPKGGGLSGRVETGYRNPRDVWTIPTKPYKGAHFAVMPLELAGRCIKAGLSRGGTVLDPFAGSGTTGVAAKSSGRDYILIEANPEYIELIKERLSYTNNTLNNWK